MQDHEPKTSWRESSWRKTMWAGAVVLLLLPVAAMQFTADVQWDAPDFLLMSCLLAAACGAIELAARASVDRSYRLGVLLAALAIFLLIWINLAVGIIGSESNPANEMFAGVIVVAIGGAFLARFRPAGLARAMQAAAASQLLVAVIAFASGAGTVFPITAMFMALWLGAGYLFGQASQR